MIRLGCCFTGIDGASVGVSKGEGSVLGGLSDLFGDR